MTENIQPNDVVIVAENSFTGEVTDSQNLSDKNSFLCGAPSNTPKTEASFLLSSNHSFSPTFPNHALTALKTYKRKARQDYENNDNSSSQLVGPILDNEKPQKKLKSILKGRSKESPPNKTEGKKEAVVSDRLAVTQPPGKILENIIYRISKFTESPDRNNVSKNSKDNETKVASAAESRKLSGKETVLSTSNRAFKEPSRTLPKHPLIPRIFIGEPSKLQKKIEGQRHPSHSTNLKNVLVMIDPFLKYKKLLKKPAITESPKSVRELTTTEASPESNHLPMFKLPKKRGRKPKGESISQSPVNKSTLTEGSQESNQLPLPKKRGRKPKGESISQSPVNKSTLTEGSQESNQLPLHKKRGRKRKGESISQSPVNKSTLTEGSQESNQLPLPKKRGRKRKGESISQSPVNKSTLTEGSQESNQLSLPKKHGRKPKGESISQSPVNKSILTEGSQESNQLSLPKKRVRKPRGESISQSPVNKSTLTEGSQESNQLSLPKKHGRKPKGESISKSPAKLLVVTEGSSESKHLAKRESPQSIQKKCVQKLKVKSKERTVSKRKTQVKSIKESAHKGKEQEKDRSEGKKRQRKGKPETEPVVWHEDVDDAQDMPFIFQTSPVKSVKQKEMEKIKENKRMVGKQVGENEERGVEKKKRGRGKARMRGKRKRGKLGAEVTEETDEERRVIARKKNQRRTGRRFSVTGNWYIASGYLNDLISLLEDFESCDGWRFKDFARCWQRKSFSLVYRGRQTFKELLEFAEEIALLTLRFIGPSHSTKRRIGALYTLYGLYYKFPIGHFFNIRFDLNEYKNLLELIHQFRSNVENPDPAYIFRKLELRGAITHCATPFEPCYDFHNEERDLVDLEYGKQKLAKSSAVSIAIPKFQLEADMELMNYYHNTKTQLTGNSAEMVPERALTLITPEFFTNVSNELKEMRRRTDDELGMTSNTPAKVPTRITQEPSEDVDEGRDSEDSTNKGSPEEVAEVGMNGTPRAQISSENVNHNELLLDEHFIDFMKPLSKEEVKRPLQLRSGKRKTGEIPISLNLNDIKATSSLSTRNIGRVNLELSDNENGEPCAPVHLPRKRKKRPRRPQILLQAATSRRRGATSQLKPTYWPIRKTLHDDEDQLASAESSIVSTTCLPQLHQQTDNTENMESLHVNVSLTFGELLKTINLKLVLSKKEVVDIKRDPSKLKDYKQKLVPLVRKSLNAAEREKLWLMQEISICNDSSYKKKNSRSDRAITFKKKFECLRHDSSSESSDEESSDESVSSKPPKVKKSDRDIDYIPPSLAEEIAELERDALLEEELDEEVVSDWSDGYDYHYFPRKRGRRRHCFVERATPDSDKLISKKGKKTLTMMTVNIGGKIRYLPIDKESVETPIVECEKENHPIANEMQDDQPIENDYDGEVVEKDELVIKGEENADDLITWSDFSSPICPPLKKIRTGSSKHENTFSFLYPTTSKIRECLDLDPLWVGKEDLSRKMNVTAHKNIRHKLLNSLKMTLSCNRRSSESKKNRTHLSRRKRIGAKRKETSVVVEEYITPETSPPRQEYCSAIPGIKKELDHLEQLEEDWGEELPEEDVIPKSGSQRTVTTSHSGQNNIVTPLENVLYSIELPALESPLKGIQLPTATHISEQGPDSDEETIQTVLYSSCDGQQIFTNDDKSILYYKVNTTDGKDVYLPMSSLPQDGSNYIEILSVDGSDLTLSSPSSMLNSQPGTSVLIQERGDSVSPSFDWSQMQMLTPPNFVSGINSVFPNSLSNSVMSVDNSIKPATPTPAPAKPKCSFVFSSKLKRLTKEKCVASGRPPTSEGKSKVRFFMKGMCSSTAHTLK